VKGNLDVIKALEAAAAQEAHLNLQYRLDARSLKFMGLKKLTCKMKKFGDGAHCFLKLLTDRTLFLGGDPGYDIAPVVEQTSVTALLKNALALEMAVVDPYEQNVQLSMKALDDTTRNLFEHLLKWHQKHIGWLEQQLRLIDGLGETEYMAEKL
jgi:bacterioferritin